MNRSTRIAAPLAAFILTAAFLAAAIGAVQVDYVSHRALHGETVTMDVAALHRTAKTATKTAEAVLPSRIAVAIEAFRHAVEVVAEWMT